MSDTLTPSPWISSWSPQINWAAPAIRLLQELVRVVPEGTQITVFGSAPLQICLDARFLSQDVDCFGPAELKQLVKLHGLGEASREPYIQVCDELNFRASPRWKDRVHLFPLEGRVIRLPHPVDILIGKLHRLEEKDLKAFQLVREKTGHPTEIEMIDELQGAVDLFRPGFDEETAGDLKINTRILWREFFGHDINVAEQIIRPALQRRQEGYVQDQPVTDYKARLRE